MAVISRNGPCLGALALAACPAFASADALAAFEARCLTPMVELRESDVSGLRQIEEMAGRETWVIAGQDWSLHRATAEAEVQYCAIIGEFSLEASDGWAEAAVASGDYEVIETEPLRLRSVFIREPRIEVEFDMLVPSVTVIETDLES